MTAMLFSLFILTAGAAGAAAFGRNRLQWLGPLVAVAGGIASAVSGFRALVTGVSWEVIAPWQIPLGALHIGLDPLSAVFVILIAVVGALGRQVPNFETDSAHTP